MSAAKTTRSSKQADSAAEERHVAAEKEYAAAMALFVGKRDLEAAATRFEQLIERYQGQADVGEIVDRARVHLSACRARLAPPAPEPTDAAGWLHEGVCRANQGRVDEALEALAKAEQLGAPVARTAYVRAAALAAAGRHQEALADLERAIEADPDNRAFCLGDPDFESLRELPGYVALVEPPSGVAVRREVSDHAPKVDPEFGEEPPSL